MDNNETQHSSPSSDPIPSALTCESFAPHVGETFLMTTGEDTHADMVLISAEPSQLRPFDGRAVGKSGFVRRDPFSLIFRGPDQPMFNQGFRAFEHGALGTFELFIVPVGPGETGLLYQVVFS
jgi:hypothetical protein